MIKEFEPVVENILSRSGEEFQIAKESDAYLYGFFLREQGHDLTSITTNTLLKLIHDGHFPSFETIARVRRRVQQRRPDLRGKNYLKRHKLAEEVRGELQS
jgi:hypothetical protein